jgi:phage baseplate assembly protein W
MAATFARLGTDLRLLHDLLHQNSRNAGSDLSTITQPDRQSNIPLVDLETLSTKDNLEQALLLRFLTPVGELAVLGHPDYGSRLFELIGELNNETNRNRAKLYVLEALAAEPRVEQPPLLVRVTQNKAVPTEMDIEIHLKPIDSDSILNLVFPFFLA